MWFLQHRVLCICCTEICKIIIIEWYHHIKLDHLKYFINIGTIYLVVQLTFYVRHARSVCQPSPSITSRLHCTELCYLHHTALQYTLTLHQTTLNILLLYRSFILYPLYFILYVCICAVAFHCTRHHTLLLCNALHTGFWVSAPRSGIPGLIQ